MNGRCLKSIALLALLAWNSAEAAIPTCANPIPNQTWTGTGSKSYQFPATTCSDSDGDTLRYSATLANGARLPTWLKFNATTRTFSGNPPIMAAPLSIKVTANDGHFGKASTTFTLSFTTTNDTPRVATLLTNHTWNGPGLKNFRIPATTFTDGDIDTLTYSVTLADGSPLPGWLKFSPTRRTFLGNPPAGLTQQDVRITVRDGKGGSIATPLRFLLTSANDTPIMATPIANQNWSGSDVKSFQVPASTFSDADGDTLTWSATLADGAALPAWLSFAPGTRTFSGNPPANATPLSLKVTVNDGQGGRVSSAPFTLTFSNANDAPVAVNDSLTTNEITAINNTLTATDGDGDGDALTYIIVTNGSKGTASITNATTGAFTYTPRYGMTGADSFTFKVNDGRADSNTATVTINIVDMPNVAPVAVDGTLTLHEGVTKSGTLIATDANQDPLTYRLVVNGTLGSVTINPTTGAYSYISNSVGTDTFTFKVNDGIVDSNTTTVTVTNFPKARTIKTGQTVSYATGDDGDLEKGVAWPDPRFTDNDNGTVTDNLTGLVWMKNANCWVRMNWPSALTKITGLNAGTQTCTGYTSGTHSDWRLPNLLELQSLIDSSQVNPALSASHPFSGVQSEYYWSSTTYADYTFSAWFVNLYSGGFRNDGKMTTNYVWPVRGGEW
ncbi:MAG: tandem-95 repeat protein [Magnetococcales bacterium]|nr:tandem-95 repeat protein [Magnetococcales bacterium]NGZ07127.1 tandem-95 repeat protein [Magnetococcales bacterium]